MQVTLLSLMCVSAVRAQDRPAVYRMLNDWMRGTELALPGHRKTQRELGTGPFTRALEGDARRGFTRASAHARLRDRADARDGARD